MCAVAGVWIHAQREGELQTKIVILLLHTHITRKFVLLVSIVISDICVISDMRDKSEI